MVDGRAPFFQTSCRSRARSFDYRLTDYPFTGNLMAIPKTKNNNSAANLGFEAKLWLAADKLRSNMDAVEYKHVVIGLIFLKYISDAFEEIRARLLACEGVRLSCMVALPGQLFYSTQIPVCLLFLARNKHDRKRSKQPLFVCARRNTRITEDYEKQFSTSVGSPYTCRFGHLTVSNPSNEKY